MDVTSTLRVGWGGDTPHLAVAYSAGFMHFDGALVGALGHGDAALEVAVAECYI